MNTCSRTSSIPTQLPPLQGKWQTINAMPTLITSPDDAINAEQIAIADLSCLMRWGIKGSQAANWLQEKTIPLPDQSNSWCPLPQGGIIARLGNSEFLLEDSLNSAIALHLSQTCQPLPAQVYPVWRQDLAIALCGKFVDALLQQTCHLNLAELNPANHPVMLTTMAGVTVTILPILKNQEVYYRVWCDYTYGAYLWQTLVAIAQELGGGVIGAQTFLYE